MIERIYTMLRRWWHHELTPHATSTRRELEELEERHRAIRARAEALGVRVDVRTRRYDHAHNCKQD